MHSHKTCELPFCKWLRSKLPQKSGPAVTASEVRFLNADTGHETDILFRCPCRAELLEIMFIVPVQQKYKLWCFWQVGLDLVVIIHSTASGLPYCSRQKSVL